MNAVNLQRLDAASMKLEHAAAMADVLHDVAFKDLTDDTLQAYVHGLREQIVAAMVLMNETDPATKSNDAALAHSSTAQDELACAAMSATSEISSLGDRIQAETTGASPREDEGLIIRSHARRITQLSDALMCFLADGAGSGLVGAGLVAAGAADRGARVPQ